MPSPSDWHKHKIEKPKNDNEYFERMSRVIFMSGLNWRILDKKWPAIKKAFANFDIDKVAGFKEVKIGELMNNPDVIRNLAKIKAVVSNAKEIQQIIKEQGSFENYLTGLDKSGGEDELRQTLSKRFAFLGQGTTIIFLFSVGQKLPKAHQDWQAQH